MAKAAFSSLHKWWIYKGEDGLWTVSPPARDDTYSTRSFSTGQEALDAYNVGSYRPS